MQRSCNWTRRVLPLLSRTHREVISNYRRERERAIGGGTGCRMHPISPGPFSPRPMPAKPFSSPLLANWHQTCGGKGMPRQRRIREAIMHAGATVAEEFPLTIRRVRRYGTAPRRHLGDGSMPRPYGGQLDLRVATTSATENNG